MNLIISCIQISVVMVLVAVSACAQSSVDLESKYGTPFKAYEIRPGIMMTVKFDENGQASEMRIERHGATASGENIDTVIPLDLSKEIIDELVPAAERGPKIEFFGITFIVGSSVIANDDYGNVAVTYHSGYFQKPSGPTAIVIKWKKRLHP